jgi:hypothetical protein
MMCDSHIVSWSVACTANGSAMYALERPKVAIGSQDSLRMLVYAWFAECHFNWRLVCDRAPRISDDSGQPHTS